MSKRATYVFGLKSFHVEKPPKCFWMLSPNLKAAAVYNFLPSWGPKLPGRNWDHRADKLQITQECPSAPCSPSYNLAVL